MATKGSSAGAPPARGEAIATRLARLVLEVLRDPAQQGDQRAFLQRIVDRITADLPSITHASVLSGADSPGGPKVIAAAGDRAAAGAMADVPLRGAVAAAIATGAVSMAKGAEGVRPEGAMSAGSRAAICVPLKAGGRVAAFLNVESRSDRAFSDGDMALMETVGLQIAQRLEILALIDAIREKSAKVERITGICRRVLAAPSLDDALAAAARSIVDEYGCYCTCIALTSADGRYLEHRSHHARVPVDVPPGYRQEIERGLVGRAARLRRTVCCHDVSADPEYVAIVPGVRSELCIPLMSGETLIGVIDINSSEIGGFGEEDVRLLETLAGQLGLIVEKARELDRTARTRDYLEHLIASAGDGIMTLSEEGRITRWNRGMERLLGYRADEMIGRHYADLPWEGLEPGADALMDRARAGTIVEGLERRCRCREGGVIDVALTMSPVDPSGGAADGVSVIVRDVTERNRMERGYREMHLQMRASEEKFLALIERSRDAVFFVDGATGAIVQANARAEEMTRLNRTDLAGRCFVDLHPPEEAQAARDHLQTAIAAGACPALDFRLRVPDGAPIEVEVTPSLLNYGGRHLVQWLCRDISERRRAERERKALQEQLIQSEKLSAVGQLISGVAHELNNPLTGVIGYAQLLTAQEVDERTRRGLDKVYAEARRCHRIVQNLLTFARKHVPEKRRLSVNDVVESVIELRAYQMRSDGFRIEKDLSLDLPLTTGDFHQLQQVFMNIIINAHQAFKQAGKGSTITVKTAASGGVITVTIADDGPGIAEADLKRIFDPFFTTKEPGQGTGLGLSLCYGIVQEHQGRITVRSARGSGAEFTVHLPVRADDETPPTGASADGSFLDKPGSSRYL